MVTKRTYTSRPTASATGGSGSPDPHGASPDAGSRPFSEDSDDHADDQPYESSAGADLGVGAGSGASVRASASGGSARPTKREGGRAKRRPALIVATVLLCVVVLVVGLFTWDRWLRYDDAADIQGTWQVSGAGTTVVIDESLIWISDDVAYSYTIDTTSKTIAFTFGELSGAARYWFSADRTQLILVDGQDYTWTSTLGEDLGLMASQVISVFSGEEAATLADDENATVLEAS